MFKAIFSAIIVTASYPVALVAQDKLPDVAVSFADLDLSRASDIRILDKRLNNAVRAACPADRKLLDLNEKRAVRQCRDEKAREVASLREVVLAKARANGTAVALAH